MTTLICTVGGSHQPIVKAINELKPKKIYFICSQDGKGTGKKGSYISVIGKGLVNPSFNPSESNIATLCQLSNNQIEVIKVDPDYLESIYFKILKVIQSIDENEDLVADYSGGTKSMSAALALAAVDQGININLVVGARSDHVKVEDGTEESMPVNIDYLGFTRKFSNICRLWSSYSYSQALLEAQKLPTSHLNKSEKTSFIQLSRAFDAWDKLDYLLASRILNNYRSKIAKHYLAQLQMIDILVSDNKDKTKSTAYLIIDLWNNAKRKSSQGYFDDAVARVYRMLELTAQWILETDKGWRTADLPDEAVIPGVNVTINRNGQKQTALLASWQLIGSYAQGDLKIFIDNEMEKVKDLLNIRNHSLLAHGFDPIYEKDWGKFNNWIIDCFVPMFQRQIKVYNIGKDINLNAMQLPTEYKIEIS
ncbi:MAG: TIGR02710 family CRISPR-associated CARF protein [Enterobacterales bacterium]|nr:TIGR02710 family CRISPR-associated CARF protein [Enterobacterales bacterium]